ncbi:MAG: NRDE family protein [Novosphingobium sp.]
MCVAAIAWRAHPRWRLVAIGNRDEFHDRPAAPLAEWNDGSGAIAGKDLRAGGTWLGVTAAGRFGLVTNFRVPGYPRPGLASRGALVTDWLKGRPLPDIAAMNPFNLCLADREGARILTNHPEPEAHELAPGVHGLSNGAFARPWPKTRQLAGALEDWLGGGAEGPEPLFAALRAENPLAQEADEDGPELPFSPVFIRNEAYGTRCSTVAMIGHDGRGFIEERSFDAQAGPIGARRIVLS